MSVRIHGLDPLAHTQVPDAEKLAWAKETLKSFEGTDVPALALRMSKARDRVFQCRSYLHEPFFVGSQGTKRHFHKMEIINQREGYLRSAERDLAALEKEYEEMDVHGAVAQYRAAYTIIFANFLTWWMQGGSAKAKEMMAQAMTAPAPAK